MRLTILGGGGFRVPLVHRAPLGDRGEGRVTDVHGLATGGWGRAGLVVRDDLGAGRHGTGARGIATFEGFTVACSRAGAWVRPGSTIAARPRHSLGHRVTGSPGHRVTGASMSGWAG